MLKAKKSIIKKKNGANSGEGERDFNIKQSKTASHGGHISDGF